MIFGHAAALALIGWYLMCPPLAAHAGPELRLYANSLGRAPLHVKTNIPTMTLRWP
jgi:hypothetical protein